MRRILSIWLPRLAIERWQIARQRARRLALPDTDQHTNASKKPAEPFVLVASGVKGTRITATNRAAERAGITIGQMLTDARAGCPEILAEQGEADLDQAWLERLGNWAMRYSPVVALDGVDGLLIDIAGCDHLFGGEQALLDDVLARFCKIGLTARLGLADTPGAAWALARFARQKNASVIAAPGKTLPATAALPVEALQLDERVVLLLHRLGLKRIDDLRAIPRPALERRFRSREAAFSVQLRLDQLAGDIHQPLCALQEIPPWREVLSCAEPAIDQMAISMALDHLLHRMSARLQRQGLGARSLTLTVCHSDGGYDALHVRLARAARQPEHIARLFRDRLEEINPGFGIDFFILAAGQVEAMAEQQQSLVTDNRQAGAKELTLLIDRLINRLGVEHVTRLYPYESHLPEQAQQIIPMAMVPGGASNTAVAWASQAPLARPFRLFDQPEPIETIAEVPDGPPRSFTWRGFTRKIVRSSGPERIAPEWWQQNGAGRAQFIRCNARDYFHVEDEEGSGYWLFRAGLYGAVRHGNAPQWFIHGLFG